MPDFLGAAEVRNGVGQGVVICDWEKRIHAAQSLTPVERGNLFAERDHALYEWESWLAEIEDAKLVRRASRMDIYLDDIPVPADEEDRASWEPQDRHYRFSDFANLILVPECRSALKKAMRERAPAYRKERREVWELWIKIGTLAVAALTGLIGTAIGLVSLLKK